MIKFYVPERTLRLIADFCGKTGAISNVFFEKVGDRLNVAATNGSVLAIHSIPFGDGWEIPDIGFAADLKSIYKNFSKNRYNQVCLYGDGKNTISFKLSSTGCTLSVPKFNGIFPNYKAVVLNDNTPEATRYNAIAWKNMRLIENVLGNYAYSTPKQGKGYQMMWKKEEWTIVCMPIVSKKLS